MNRTRAIALLAGAAALALLAVVAPACDDAAAPDPQNLLPRDECVIAAVASDFRGSTSVSLLAADGRPCATDVVHSGSRPPGLLTALSGDVVLPTEPPPVGAASQLILIDRYPNGIVTVLDPDARKVAVEAQYAVAPGFPGNPQDILVRADGTAIVSRLERNPRPTAATIDFDDGSDLLVIDSVDGRAVGRIDLAGAAEPGFDPMPARLAEAGGLVWAGLAHLSTPHFDAAGPGRVAAVDADARALVAVVPVVGLTNCGQIAPAPATAGGVAGVWVVCSGRFASDAEAQLRQSGLAWVDAAARAATWVGPAAELGGAPFGLAIAALDADRVLAVSLGDAVAKTGDRLVLVDRRTSAVTPLLTTALPFEVGGILPSLAAGVLLVAIHDPYAPRIERLSLPDFAPLTAIIDSSATGLPPAQLAFFRPAR